MALPNWRLQQRKEILGRPIDQAYATATNGAISLGVASLVVLNQNPNRKFAVIVNDSANTIYLAFGNVAVGSTGIRLNANGGVITFGLATDIPYTGTVTGIAPAGTSVVTFIES